MIEERLAAAVGQMVAAIRNMRTFTESMSFQEYQADPKTRLAVERCVEIISEAARRLPDAIQESQADIPWEDIKSIGNILRHGYDRIDDRIIWSVVQRHLTPLEAALTAIAMEHNIEI